MMDKWFYSKEELENLADNINRCYYPERLEKIELFDSYDFLEKLGLEIEWKYISPNMQILGIYFFEDGYWLVWPKGEYHQGDRPKWEFFKKGTIVINNNLVIDKKMKLKEVFICLHECGHHIKDKNFFETHENDVYHICAKQDFEKTSWSNNINEIDIIERQTNYLAAAILMPRDIIKREFFRKLRFKNIPQEPIKLMPYMKKYVKELAVEFGVNYNPVLYRLYDLKILERENEYSNVF